ncbi:MAG: hypothetical protein U1E23_09600 [Reyranellaceae bacterium]
MPGGLQPLNFQLSIFDGIDPGVTAGGSKGGFGSFRIQDPAGDLDYLIGKVMSGGTLTLLRGAPGALYSTFTAVATLTSAGMVYDHQVKEIRVRDLGWKLDVPLHDNRYGGAGGADGDAAIKSVLKPYTIGQVFNVAPVLIEASKLIYQLSDSAITSIADVRDGGYSLTFGTTRADYAAMAGSAPAKGNYDVCLPAGLIRLGSSPAHDITVDFTGDKTGGGSAYLKRGDIANQVATRAGTTIAVNSSALSALNSAQTGTCGFHWLNEITKRQALDEVMAGIAGYHYVNLSGELVLGYLAAPTGSAVATYTWPTDVADLPSQMDAYQEPRWKTTLGYQRNYALQDRSKLAGAVGQALKFRPTLIDGTKNIYQITDSRTPAITSIAAVRDAGSSLTTGTSRADYTALAGTAPSAGAYDYCLAAGLIRLGSAPTGDVDVDFTSTITEAAGALYGQEAQWVTGETSSQRTYWPTAPEVKLFSGFYGSSDASTEASRQKTLFQGFPTGSMIERYKVKLRDDPFTLAGYLGQVIEIAAYPRYSWANPRKFLLVGVEFSGDATTTATLWG